MNRVTIWDKVTGEIREQTTHEHMTNLDFMLDIIYPFVVSYVGAKVLCGEKVCFSLEYEDEYGNRQLIEFENLAEVQKWYQD